MSKTPHDKAIDKDLDDLGLWMSGVQGWLAAEERIAHRDIEKAEGATPQEIQLLERNYQDALKHEKEAHDAYQIIHRLEAEIGRLRKGRR